MKLYYSESYDLHVGFDSSWENKDRIEKVLKSFSNEKEKLICLQPKKFTLQKEDLSHLSDLSEYLNFLQSSFLEKKQNCPVCTFTFPFLKNEQKCEMCMSPCTRNVKLVSETEGDTTYMCDTSLVCIKDLLSGIENLFSSPILEDIFILTRPPGHHSNNRTPSGFCLVNNIAYTTDLLLRKGKRICILDYDVHHGNGTQEIFYETDSVFFIDIHRDNFYPFTGKKEEVGKGKGKGYTLNIPLEKGSGEKEYIEAFNSFLPKIKKYQPDYILVSCGFDAHEKDIGGMKLKSESYGKFHSILSSLGIRLIYFLEGGYQCEIILECIQSITNAK